VDLIELSGPGAAMPEFVAQVSDALAGLRRTWPGGATFVRALVRRIELDPNPELNSKTVSELPGLVILGRHATAPEGAAELLVHEAAHLLVYEMARLQAVLPAPEAMRHSPFSRADARPAYMVLHGTASFCAQAVTTARWSGARSGADAQPALSSRLRDETALLKSGEQELQSHLAEHRETPHAFVAALFEEISLLERWLGE
jgi:HEXXH motif-containing protein